MLHLRGLLESRDELNRQLALVQQPAVEEIWRLIRQFDIQFIEIDPDTDRARAQRRQVAATRKSVAQHVKFLPPPPKQKPPPKPKRIKYRHPVSGKVWHGRDPAPKWFRVAVESGVSPESMAIQKP